MAQQKSITCIDCGHDIPVDSSREYKVGDILECTTCGTELEVIEIRDDGELVVEPLEEEK